MLKLSFTQLVVGVFPEYLLLTYIGVNLLGLKTNIYNCLQVATICTAALGLIRNISSLYGIHTLIMIFVFAVAIKLVMDIELRVAMIASLLALFILGLGETVLVLIGIKLFQFEVTAIINKNIFYVVSFLEKIPLFMIVVGIYCCDWRLVNWGEDKEE